MIQQLFDQNILIYTMVGLFGLGVILKLMIKMIYSHMIKASNNMGTSKNKLMKNMKLKFITFYKLKIGVNNVDIFVDKYINNHKFMGILLTTWENFSAQLIIPCALIGSMGAILGFVYEIDRLGIIRVFSVGIVTCGLLIFFDGLLNFKGKKAVLRLNVMDYLDNYLKTRLEQEEANPEILEEYKKEYAKNQNNAFEFIAASDAINQKKVSRKERRERKRATGIQKRVNARLERQRKKEQKKATKDFKRQSKSMARIKRKEDKRRRKAEAKQEIKRLKRESQLEKLRKKEEKQMQADIKRTLKFHHQPSKEKEKNLNKTPAQAKKESLKREIRERRQIKASDSLPEVEHLEAEQVFIKKEEAVHKEEAALENEGNIKEETYAAATIEEAKPQKNTINFVQSERKVHSKRNQKKKPRDGHLDEQIIEDILKEFLA